MTARRSAGRSAGRSLVTEVQGERQHPALQIREQEAAAIAEHGPITARKHVGNGLVFYKHADGTSYYSRLPDRSRY